MPRAKTQKKDDTHAPQAVITPRDEEMVVWEYGALDKETLRFLSAGHGEKGKKDARDFAKGSGGIYLPAKRLVHTAEPLKETD